MAFQKGHIISEATREKMRLTHKGMRHTEESKLKMSIASKGKPKSAAHRAKMITFPKIYKVRKASSTSFKKGCPPWNKGKQWSDAMKKKLSLAHTGKHHPRTESGLNAFREKMSGENHFAWVNDRTQLKDDSKERGGQLHREWSRMVKRRDRWTCKMQNSDCSGGLVAHHIVAWRDSIETRYNIENGITLCHSHHPRLRIKEKQMEPFFTELLSLTPPLTWQSLTQDHRPQEKLTLM